MAKKSGTSQLLVLALFLSVGLSVILCYRYVVALRNAAELQGRASRLQVQALLVNRNRAVMQNVAREVAEYAQRTPPLQTFLAQYAPLYQQLNSISNAPSPGAGSPRR